MKDFLNINIRRSSDPHRDIYLNITSNNLQCEADSYYLLLDKGVENQIGGFRKVLTVLIQILEGWKIKVESLRLGSVDYLPFDFSDEYIGCLRVELLAGLNLSIQYGFTQKLMGMELSPSDVENFVIQNIDFVPTSTSVFWDKELLVQNLNRCIENFTLQIANES